MKPDLLVHGAQMPHVTARLEAGYTLHRLAAGADTASLPDAARGVRGLITTAGARRPLIDALPKLEIVSSFGVGTDSVDVDYAKSRGIVVCNTPGVLDDDVANLAVALLLAVTRKLVAYDRYVREGRWLKHGAPSLTRGIAGRRVGIVGMGRIGRAIADKLAVFGVELAYHTRTQRADIAIPYYADLVALAEACDALIVIVPGGAGTEKLIDRAVLDALGREGVLVNIARGSVVDEPALVAALEDGRLGGAGLDVFVEEPTVPEALFKLDNVVLQPHQGSATIETRRAMGSLTVDNLDAHFAGRTPPATV